MSLLFNWKWLFTASRIHVGLQRFLYSGPPGTPDYTKTKDEKNLDWETKKLRNIRQRVIDYNEQVEHQGDLRIVDDEERKVYNLPHIIFSDNPNKYNVEGFSMEVLGQEVPKNLEPKRSSNVDPDFARQEVQKLLKNLTGKDMDKIYRRLQSQLHEMPHIRYLTDKQLKEEFAAAEKKAEEWLVMPPVMLEREPIDHVIAIDSKLDGYEHSNIVFTDITDHLPNNKRFIVIREPDGKLRKANWDERDRILQTYFTKPERSIAKPSFFNDMTIIFENKMHENALEQILAQHDPDSAQYIDLTQKVYQDIDKHSHFDLLRSTRFFPGLAFYLAKHASIDNMLVYFIKNNLLAEASDLIQLFVLLKPKSKTASKLPKDSTEIKMIEVYMSNDADNANFISGALRDHIVSLKQTS